MGKLILTADDSASVRQMVSFTLKRSGYDVVEAVDGRDAVTKLSGKKVDLLIADLNMLSLDGIGLIKEVRSKAGFAVYADPDAHNRVAGIPKAGREDSGRNRLDRKAVQSGPASCRREEGARMRK